MKIINRKKQTGATLLVALILLLIMTIVGIGASKVSKMQYQMARNTQFELDMYQVALSENNAQLKDLTLSNKLIADTLGSTDAVNLKTDGDSSTEIKMTQKVGDEEKTKAGVDTNFKILGRSKASKYFSMDGDFGISVIMFELQTAAKVPGSTIGSSQVQGASILSPKTLTD